MPVVDVHTHMYPTALMQIFRARNTVPYVRSFPASSPAGAAVSNPPTTQPPSQERLIILPAEDTASTSRGRPIGPEYSSASAKIAFMDAHGIDISVLSLANPWLDWLPAGEAAATARVVNDDIEATCAAHEGRLYAFGTLPLSASAAEVVAEVRRLKTLPHCRGIVMGTSGLGEGLDDPALDPIYAAMEEQEMLVFLHPHYGLPSAVYGPRAGDYGHVLPLAMGFPMETTIAVTRLILSGGFDRFPRLKMLLAHSGGTLPFLAGRIESCIAHDGHLKREGKVGEGRRTVWEVLKNNIWLDAVIYADVGLKAAIDASGADRLLFGTDHPFFPPLDHDETEWLSVTLNSKAVRTTLGDDETTAAAIMGGNAVRLLQL